MDLTKTFKRSYGDIIGQVCSTTELHSYAVCRRYKTSKHNKLNEAIQTCAPDNRFQIRSADLFRPLAVGYKMSTASPKKYTYIPQIDTII